jgi:hypothetical protein
MNRKTISIGLIFFALLAVGFVFAGPKYTKPVIEYQRDYSGTSYSVRVKNPNTGKGEDLKNIEICIRYTDGQGVRQELTPPAFNLAPKEERPFTVYTKTEPIAVVAACSAW